MNKEPSNLASTIAQLGTNLAERRRSVESDIVVPKNGIRKDEVKNLAVRLVGADIALLQEIQLWAHQNGINATWSALVRAGLRAIRKDEEGLKILRQTLQKDRRKKGA
jgi:hypothetical protein